MEVLSSHILLRPVDLDRSRRFYRDELGLAIYRFRAIADELPCSRNHAGRLQREADYARAIRIYTTLPLSAEGPAPGRRHS